ncbi:unnamed protein product, partial [Mesorhabditis belari]|uniref:Coiled-coil domain-containing protein 186 n=1 Tax=Mesorhabditis belari TaxID=2138241 RepID=A0AAF3EQN5_9BILA
MSSPGPSSDTDSIGSKRDDASPEVPESVPDSSPSPSENDPPPRPPAPKRLTPESTPQHVAQSAEASPLHGLYEKFGQKEKEIERLEKQNTDYREQLIRTIRERDLNEGLLKNVRDEQAGKFAELEKKVYDLESQLRVTKDRANAQELHYNNTTKDLTTKFNTQVAQLTKRQETAEKEKNEAVVKYAMKEGEIMRVVEENKRKEEDNKKLKQELDEFRKSADHQRVTDLEKAKEALTVELEKVKHERFDLDNRLKISEKRLEVVQLALNDQKQQNEVLRRQLMQVKEEKSMCQETIRSLELRIQSDCEKKTVESEEANKVQNEREEIYRNIVEEVARTKKLNRELGEKVEELTRENTSLLTNLQTIETQLRKEEIEHLSARKRVDELEGIERKVNGSLDEARKARLAQEEAENDRNTAETEADQCRKQAERMLEITEQLTNRNTQMCSELEAVREEKTNLQEKLIEAEGALKRAESKLADNEMKDATSSTNMENEIESMKSTIATKNDKIYQLEKQLDQEVTSANIYRKKTTANIKELKNELSQLRKQLQTQQCQSTPEVVVELPGPSSGSRSRTSSITSIDQVGRSSEASYNLQSPQEEIAPPFQQAMIEKIVKLQKQLARRTEKIEFLEEHVKQCLEELQKKTKIIQYYALREEASLLVPDDKDLRKVPISKRTAPAYSLMGSMWSTGNDKSALQLATEVNSRLQAVLEETLLKNIALKTSVDNLGEEIARLSRENRQLSLKS